MPNFILIHLRSIEIRCKILVGVIYRNTSYIFEKKTVFKLLDLHSVPCWKLPALYTKMRLILSGGDELIIRRMRQRFDWVHCRLSPGYDRITTTRPQELRQLQHSDSSSKSVASALISSVISSRCAVSLYVSRSVWCHSVTRVCHSCVCRSCSSWQHQRRWRRAVYSITQ